MHKAVRYACLAAIVGLLVPAFINVINVHQADASSYDVRSVPTTIDLNDLTSSEIISYYKDLPSSSSEKQGTNLLKNLKPILKNNQKYFSYGGSATTAVWQAYEIVDRDWVKSPASAISGYNASTNKITGYVYGSSVSKDKGTNPYIHALYVNRNVTNQTTAWSDHDQDQWGINQEHIWAKSCGFQNTSPAAGARGDLMHLWAGNGKVNGAYHSNYYYGYVDKTKSYDDPAVKDNMPNLSGNLMGKSKTFPSSTYNVFEPQDSDKGDIARAIFYMVARYNNYSGSDSDGFDSGNPNLELVNQLNWAPGTSYTSSATKKGQMGILQDLLEWNRIDPPDQWEIHRNNLLYKNFTNNRNPFIDFPEWAEYIWGKSEDGSYSSTPTGSADTGSDKINGFSDDVTPAVKHVSVSPTVLNLEAGNSSTLTATVTVTNGASTDVTWTSSDTSVATVTSSGEVTAVADGSATITVRSTYDNTKYAACSVTVGSGGGGGEDGSYTIKYDDTFSPALPDSSSGVNTNPTAHTDSTASNFAFKEAGVYKGSSNSYLMFYQGDNVNGYLYNTEDLGTIDSVSVTYTSSTSETGKIGVYFGSSEQSTYTNTNNQTIKGRSQTDTFTNTTSGNGFFQLSTSNKNVQITQIVINYHSGSVSTKTLTDISLDIENAKTEFDVGDTFEYDGLVVTANYDDDTSDTVTPTSVSTPDLTTAGTKEVTVTYTENGVTKTATYDITVSVAPTSVSISPNGGTIDVGDTLQLTATVLPADAPDKSVEWSSSDEEVATISDSGLVTGISEGTATIYATTINNKKASCTVTVSSSEDSGVYTIGWGTASGTPGTYSNFTAISGEVTGLFSFEAKKNGQGSNPAYNSTNNELRLYYNSEGNGCSVVITTNAGITITNAIITTSTSPSVSYYVDGGSAQSVSYADGKYTISNINASSTLEIKNTNIANVQLRILTIKLSYTVSDVPITSIEATISKVNYHPGETISSSDVTVTANTGAIIDEFILVNDGYMFTYSDAPSGGFTKTKEFTVKATPEDEELSCTFTVNVSRVAYVQPETVSDTLNKASTGNPQSYTSWSNVAGQSGAVYAGHSNGGNGSIQLRSSKTDSTYNSGIISTSSGGNLKSISVTWESHTSSDRTLNVYGKNSPYSSPNDLYSGNETTSGTKLGTIVCGTSTSLNITGNYTFIGLCSNSGAMYLESIEITYSDPETAINVSNYIMYEDTNGQCETKFDIASGYFNAMSVAERATFMTSQDYVIASARERFEDWAKHLGKTIEVENNDYVIKAVKPVVHIFNNEAHDNVSIIIIISIMGIGAIAGYFYFRKKKYQ